MSETINSRIQLKHDTEANWDLVASSFVPKKGEVVVYEPDITHTNSRFKIGDGTTAVGSLKFLSYMPDFPNAYNISSSDYLPVMIGNNETESKITLETLRTAIQGSEAEQTAMVNYIKSGMTITGSGSFITTFNDSNIKSNMVALESILSNPSAQTSDWTITTTDGSVTIAGSVSGTTNLTVYFGAAYSTAPTILTNLGSNSAANLLQENPRPGVTGVLPIAYGGTGTQDGAALSRRTRLTDFDLTALQNAIATENLAKYGLRVGDQKTINGYTYVIAGLNVMKGSHSYTCTQKHAGLIVIPHATQAWNASGNTYTGADNRGAGYKNSDLHYYLTNTVLPHCQTDLGGSSHLYAHNKLLTNAVDTSRYNRFGQNTGCSSNQEWVNCYISALSEVQVYGSTIWSSSGYDTGEACMQLPVFQEYKATDIFGNEYPWLRDVASGSHACLVSNLGFAVCYPASDAYFVAGLILYH